MRDHTPPRGPLGKPRPARRGAAHHTPGPRQRPATTRSGRAPPAVYHRIAWGMRSPARVAALTDQLETARFRYQVIHTPGHAADHVALFERERAWLFAGDLYLAPRLRYL